MPRSSVYILGGFQTDFAVTWSRAGHDISDIMQASVEGALAATDIEPREIQTAHVGNFAAELFRGQGHLGGMFASIHPAFDGLPAGRHEAACASGSLAILAAGAEIEAGRYDLACVVGVEEMRNVPGEIAARHIGGTAGWNGREATAARYFWPCTFGELVAEYDRRFGLDPAYLAAIAQKNFANARRNPNAQTRAWTFTDRSFLPDDAANPVVEGRIRRHDCGQITDGAACVMLASEWFARAYAARRGTSLETIPRIKGWGHRTAPLRYADKISASRNEPYVFPHLRGAFTDALHRAELPDANALDAVELHDCFTITEYMALDHFGLTAPGDIGRLIEAGDFAFTGRLPVNPSGGLIGLGHPVGATGVRMVLDAWKQTAGTAGDYQVANAKTVATLNIGGSATTTVSFVVGV